MCHFTRNLEPVPNIPRAIVIHPWPLLHEIALPLSLLLVGICWSLLGSFKQKLSYFCNIFFFFCFVFLFHLCFCIYWSINTFTYFYWGGGFNKLRASWQLLKETCLKNLAESQENTHGYVFFSRSVERFRFPVSLKPDATVVTQEAVNSICEKLHLRCLTDFLMCLSFFILFISNILKLKYKLYLWLMN